MSQLDLEQLELEGEEHLAENQPAPGKATLTSRIGKPHRAGAGDLIDGATHAQLAGGLGVELSRGDGGNGGGGAPRRLGPAVGFLGGGRADHAHDAAGDHVDEQKAGRGLEFLGGASLASQQRQVAQFDTAGRDDFYDQRATVDPAAHAAHAATNAAAFPDVAKTPSPGGPVPVPYPNVNVPAAPGDLRSQQRQVAQFDTAGHDDFYDQRAVVDPAAAKAHEAIPHAPPAGVSALPAVQTPSGGSAPPAATGDLRSQQRQVAQFDTAGRDDFYDQRATVDPAAGRAPVAQTGLMESVTAGPARPVDSAAGHAPVAQTGLMESVTAGAASAGAGAAASAAAQGAANAAGGTNAAAGAAGAAAQGAANVAHETTHAASGAAGAAAQGAANAAGGTNAAAGAAAAAAADAAAHAPDPATEAVKTQAQIDAEKAHEIMHAAAGSAGGAIDAAQAAGMAAQQKAAVNPADVPLNMINPDLKKPGQPHDDVPLNMINPDLKKPGQPHDDVPLNMINPDLKKPGQPGKPGDVPLDAINPDLKKPGQPGKPGDVPLDATNPDLKKQNPADVPLDATNPDLKKGKYSSQDVFIDPWADEPLFDMVELNKIDGDPAHKKPIDPAVDQHASLDGKVAAAKANPQAAKEQLKGLQADVAAKKGVIKKGVEAKTKAVHGAAGKGVSGAVSKGGKKVQHATGKGAALTGKKKAEGQGKKIEKAKSIDELKTRLNKGLEEQTAALKKQFETQRKDLKTKIEAEQKKIDAEQKAQAEKIAKELAEKNKAIDKQIADKKKAYDKQIADEKKKAEKVCKDEQKKTKETTHKEVSNIQKKGDTEASKVVSKGRQEAQAARNRAAGRAQGEISRAGDDADKKKAAEVRAQQIRGAANAEAKKIEDAAHAEAAKRKELTKQLVTEAKAKGDKAVHDLDSKLAEQMANIASKATKGLAEMEGEKKKMAAELKAHEDKLKAESLKKNEEAKFKIHTLEVQGEAKIKALEEPAFKQLTSKRDDMMMKLEKGNAADLEKLEKETNDAVAGIEKQVKDTGDAVAKEIKYAQDKAQFESNKRVKSIQDDGKVLLDELDKKAKFVQAQIEYVDKETQTALKKASEDAKENIKKQGEAGRADLEKFSEKSQAELAMTSEQYATHKHEEEEAARKKKEDEEKAKADAEKAKADAEKKKAEEEKAKEEQKKEEFKAKTNGAASSLVAAMDRWGTDEAAVMKALKGKTPEEMAAIKAEYKRLTKRDLDADLKDELSGTDLKEANALMSQDPVQQAVAQLQSAQADWTGTDRTKIRVTLAEITDPEVRKKVVAEYEKATGQRLEAMLKDEGFKDINASDYKKEEEQGPPLRELNEEEKSKSRAAVTELEGAMNRWGTDEAKVMAALKGKSPEEVAFIKKEFERRNKRSLDAALEDELSGTDLKEAKSFLTNDPVQQAVAQMHNAADGIGTDKEKLLGALKDIKDPEMRKKVAAEYEKQTGDNLQDMIKDELSGAARDRAQVLAGNENGDVNEAKLAAIDADDAMHGGFLTDISDGLADTFEVDRKKMRTAVGSALLGPEAGKQLGTDIGGTDEEALYKALESVPADKRKAFLDEYKARTGRDLDVDLKDELKPKEKDVTDAILSGDKTAAEAAKIAAAADGVGTDRKALYAALEGKSLDERRAIIAAFNKKYGSEYPETEIEVPDPNNPGKKIKKKVSGFDAMCADELDDLDRQKAEMIAEKGKMDDGFALYYGMNEGFLGIGTDDALLKERLKGKSKKEIEDIMLEYRKAKALQEGKKLEDIPADALKKDIEGETSGRVGHELGQSLKGKPETAEEMYLRAKEDYEFERKDSGWIGEAGVLVLGGPLAYGAMKMSGKTPADISNAITDTWSDSGKRLDEDFKEFERQYLAAKKAAEMDPAIQALPEKDRKAAMEKKMMEDLKKGGQADYVEGSIKQFEEAKDATADAVGTVVAVAVGALITVLSGGTAAPALVALISGLAGVSAKMIIKGASMSNEELVKELAQVAAEALAAGFVNIGKVEQAIEKLAGKFGTGMAARIIKEALEEAVESGTEELINALLDENLYKGDLADFGAQLGGRFAKAALTGAGAAVVSTGFGEVMPGMGKLGKWESKSGIPHGKAIAGAINQAVGSAFTTAIDPNTYNGSGADVAMAFGKSMGSAALRGLQDGYSTSEGGFKPGPGWGKSSSKGAGHSHAEAGTTGTVDSKKGPTNVSVTTEVDVNKQGDSVKVDAKATTTTSGPDGNRTESDSTSKTLPIDTNKKNDQQGPQNNNQQTNPQNNQQTNPQNDNKGKTQPIDVPVDTDPNSNKTTPTDGKQGADPNSNTAVDTNKKLQSEIDAAKAAHAGGDPKALQAALNKLPGASNIEVVADGFIGPLKPNQVPASTAAKAIVMMDAAMKSKVGADAVKSMQDMGITLTLNANEGSFCQGNRINIDPTMASDGNELAGILAHEVHHAKTFAKDVDINQSRDKYVAATLKNEAQAQAQLFEHYQQTGTVDSTIAQRQFGAQEYFGAYNAAAKAYAEAHPDATPEQIHAHAKQAGISALQAVFGSATPSTSVDENNQLKPGEPATYADLYGQWHDAHSPVGLVAQTNGKPIPTNKQATPSGGTPVDGPDPKLVSLTQKAFEKYSATLGEAKALLGKILGQFGEIMARAKDPISAANRLQRAIDNFGAQVTDVDSAIANIWDAIGTRVVVGNATPEVMAQTVAKLAEAIKSGELKITQINNLHGADAKPYFTADQVAALAAESQKATGKEVTTNASKVMAGGFTSVCIYVEYANGVKGEIQIIGEQAMKIANVEHLPYDVGLGKPLVRGIDSSLQGELNAITGPLEAAVKSVNADPALKAAYEKYLSEMYAYARNVEMGLEAHPPSLPSGIDQSLSVEGLQQIQAAIDAIKAKQKALEGQKKTDGEQKAPAPKVVVIPNPEADAMPPPQDKEQLLQFALKKYGNVIAKYVGAPHTSNPKFNTLLSELEGLEPGAWKNNPEKAEAALDKWMAISKEIEEASGKSEADLRELYGILEKTDMPRWLSMMEGKTDKEKAEALYEMRKQWRILVRDLMTDENSKRILYLRDRALSGHETGPAMQDLLDKNLKKTGGDVDAAYRKIVESAMRSNQKVDEGVLGKKNQPNNQNETDTKKPAPITDQKKQAEENKRRVEETKKQRDADFENEGVQGEKGKHGGTEVHSHWLGVIKSDVFMEKYGSWEAVLKAITELKNRNLRHTTHEGGQQTIKERGVAGDAMRIAEQTFKQISGDPPTHPKLVAIMNDPALDAEAKKAALADAKMKIAEDAVRQCLEASPDTDFNSAYEIRDELIKEKFGGEPKPGETKAEAEAREIRAYAELCRLTVKRLMDDGILLTEQSNSIAKLMKRFSGEMLQEAIDQNLREIAKTDPKRAEHLAENFRVAFLSMGLSINYGKQDRRWEGFRERFFSPEQKAELDARLKGVDSKSERAKITRQFESEVEQTRWLGEMTKQFGYEMTVKIISGELESLRAQQEAAMKLAKEGKPQELNENRQRIKELEGYLAELTKPGNEFAKIDKAVVSRPEIVGIDMAGQELYEFSEKGKQRFKMMYMALAEAAKAQGRVLVFRPHVGEGAINPLKGATWNAFNKRWERDGKPIHYQRAENNVESMIEVLKELQAEGLLDPSRVTVRFGHATHTNPQQAVELAKLGVIAEVNLGSNIATNVADQAEGPDGKKTKKAEEDFSDHSFLTLIFNQVQTILSTDGHAVEKTSMGEEYARAHKIIEDFLAGKMKVRVTMDQAEAGFPGRGTKKDGFVELGVEDLSTEELNRFLNAYKQLHAWANQYRGTGQRGGTPIDPDGNVIGTAQNPKAPAPLPRAPAPVRNNNDNQVDTNNNVDPQQETQQTQDQANKAELQRIKDGLRDSTGKGVIRTPDGQGANKLDNADVVKSLNSQLQRIEPGAVDKMINDTDPALQEKMKKVLARSTGFGNMESLNTLRKEMDDHLGGANAKVFAPGKGSLADNIIYNQSKGAFDNQGLSNQTGKKLASCGPDFNSIEDGTVIILDPVVMALMKDPKFVEKLKSKQVVLLEPVGFSSMNMFNTQDGTKIKENAQKILDKALALEAGGMDFDTAVQTALRGEIAQVIEAAGLGAKLKPVDPTKGAAFDADNVSKNLSGEAGMSEADLEDALKGLSPEQQNLARELLAQTGDVFSPRRFAQMLQEQHNKLMASLAGTPPENVFFLIPLKNKSYGMLAMAHQQATGTSPDRFLNGPEDVRKLQQRLTAEGKDQKNVVIIILDDVAGSGDSLHQASADIGKGTHPEVDRNPDGFFYDSLGLGNNAFWGGKVIVSPMVTTDAAKDLFANNDSLKNADGLSFQPVQPAKALTESAFFKSLDDATRIKLLDMCQERGFGQNRLAMSFPYMSPDNNSGLFWKRFARFFILNKNQKAAKEPTP